MSEAAVTVGADHEPLIIGRYALFDALASGGMATVHLGRLLGAVGFGRTVAVKRLHTHYTNDPDFVTMFMDEARIVARIRHPNVVPMVDVIESSKGLFLVMEYVHGESFSKLLRTARSAEEQVPIKILNVIIHGVLLGLHAAHETKGSGGELLDVVHRDVSPQNVIVGADGVARVLDFGVAKAAGRAQVTKEGQIKGKLTYMAPEQIRGKVDRRADIFAAAVILWEALAGRRLHEGAKDVEIVTRVVQGKFERPSLYRAEIPPELDEIVMRGLNVDPEKRFQTAREMAIEIERRVGLASPSEVGEWVERLAHDSLAARAARVAAMEKVSGDLSPLESVPPPPMPGSSGDLANGEIPRAPQLHDAEVVSLLHGDVHTGTPSGTEVPTFEAEPPRRSTATLLALFAFLGALALTGLVLGVWSIAARANPPPAPSSSSTSNPAPPLSESSSPTPPPSVSVTASASASGPRPKPSASAPPPPPPPPTARPTFKPPVAPTPPPATPKKNCDPPYTVDENGHRRYKLECMENN